MDNLKLVPQLNFAGKHRRELEIARKKDRIFLRIALGILALTVVASLSLTAWLIYSNRQLESIKQKSASRKNQLAALSEEQAKFLVFSTRLELMKDVLSQFVSHQESLEFVTSIAGPGIEFQQVEYEGDSILSFRVVTDTYFTFEEFVEKLRTQEIQDQIGSLTVQGITRNEEGNYSFEVSIGRLGQGENDNE